MNLDQFKGACWGVDQGTRATLQIPAKTWASNLFCTRVFVWVAECCQPGKGTLPGNSSLGMLLLRFRHIHN